jgi:hypothetical protein
MWWFWVEIWSKKDWFNVMLTLMLLIELCWVLYEGSFQVQGLENDEMSRRMDKSSSLGIPTHPKKYPRGTSIKAWGCPRGTPSSSAKIRSPFKTLYFYCFMHYVFFLERQLLLFSVFFCFVCCNKWLDHIMFLLEEMNSLFICQEHSSFRSYRSTSVLFFCYCV